MTAITEQQVAEFIRHKSQELRQATGKPMISISCHSGLFDTTPASWIVCIHGDVITDRQEATLAEATKKALASTDPAVIAANKRAEAARLIEEADALQPKQS